MVNMVIMQGKSFKDKTRSYSNEKEDQLAQSGTTTFQLTLTLIPGIKHFVDFLVVAPHMTSPKASCLQPEGIRCNVTMLQIVPSIFGPQKKN